jgi:hypothetical protein
MKKTFLFLAICGWRISALAATNIINREISEHAMKLLSAAPAVYFITLTTDEPQIIEVQRCPAGGRIV